MSIEIKIQPYIVAFHKGEFKDGAGQKMAAIVANSPEMLDYAKKEIARLRDTSGFRILAEHDHLSQMRCRSLEKLMAAVEALSKS